LVVHRPNTELALKALSTTQTTLSDVGLTLGADHLSRSGYGIGDVSLAAHGIGQPSGTDFVLGERSEGNATTESFFGGFKTENVSLFNEAVNIWELRRIIGQQIDYYTSRR